MELFKKKILYVHLENTSGDMASYAHALGFSVGQHNTQKLHPIKVLNINTTKFQVERKPIYKFGIIFYNE